MAILNSGCAHNIDKEQSDTREEKDLKNRKGRQKTNNQCSIKHKTCQIVNQAINMREIRSSASVQFGSCTKKGSRSSVLLRLHQYQYRYCYRQILAKKVSIGIGDIDSVVSEMALVT